jgi:hypothetical protein
MQQRKTGAQGGGNKVHGDDLEAMIPGKSAKTEATNKPEAGGRPQRDDGDNDDQGEPGSSKSGAQRGYDPYRKR